MSVTNPPIAGQTLLQTGRFTTTWIDWFITVYRVLSGKDPLQLAIYTVATLPDPVAGQIIYVSDDAGGATIAFSDGLDWFSSQGVLIS